MRPLPYWKQVGSGRWVFPTSEYALEWCDHNCHFVAYRAGRPLNCHYLLFSGGRPVCQVLTLQEADEALHDLLDSREWEGEL